MGKGGGGEGRGGEGVLVGRPGLLGAARKSFSRARETGMGAVLRGRAVNPRPWELSSSCTESLPFQSYTSMLLGR